MINKNNFNRALPSNKELKTLITNTNTGGQLSNN